MGIGTEVLALGKRPRKVQKVDGEPWGRDDIYVRKMSGEERDAYHMDVYARSDKTSGNLNNIKGWHAQVVVLNACDQFGVNIFEPGQVGELNKLDDTESLDLVFDAVRDFNGLTPLAQEELEGNSASGSGNGSSAASDSSSENPHAVTFLDGSTMTT
jgi:hypothetical protein